ncbi:MAG TPA: CHAT domain-containing tetratricopeptide repeat protein [Pyrinomonadaceae bacterium]|jgi:CHAT domain-containing protein|nr:CHAT domain-containing tetratricopeptide repeat protein [Pyrinomonadaceae bacterium]
MIIRHLKVLLLVSWLAFALLPQTQETGDAQSIEDDYRVTGIEERQVAVTNLLNTSEDLQKSGQMVEAARTLNRVGRFQIRMFVAEQAVATFQRALRLLDQQPDSRTYIESLNGLASSYASLSKCDLAEPHANQALTLSEQNHDVAGHAEALQTLSDCQDHRDHALALESAQESLALWSSIHRQRGMAEASLMIGDYQLAQHKLVECAVTLESALTLFRELNDRNGQAGVLIDLGYIEYRKGDWQNALAFYTQAQSLVEEKAEPFKMGQIAIGVGDVFLESGLPEVALVKYHEALDQFRLTKNQRAVSILKWSIGKAHYVAGQYPEAIENLQAARSDAELSGDIPLLAFCDDFLGRTYHSSNQEAAALSHFQSALDGYTKANNKREAARTQALMGLVYQQQGARQKARDNYETALDTFHLLADRVNESATLFAMGELELQEGNLDRAGDYLRRSIDATEQMRRVATSSDLTAAFSATVHDRYETYIECLMRQHHANPAGHLDVRAFETSELARGRSLAELLRNTQTNFFPGLDHQLAEREKSLRQSLRVKEDYRVRLLGTTYKKEELDSLETELSRLESEYQQVTATIHKQYPAYEQVTKPVAWTLAQIQKQVVVDDQTLLLEFSLGAQRSYIWAVSRNEVSSYELPPRSDIESEARRFYDLLTASQPKSGLTLEEQQERLRQVEAQLPAATAAFSKLLLGPVADKLGTKRLLIVADGALQYIPFQALSLPVKTDPLKSSASTNEQRLLISDHEIINEPSASILALVLSESATRKPASNSVAVLADPVFESDDPRIASTTKTATSESGQSQPSEFHQALRDVNLSGDGHIPRLLASRAEAKAIMSVAPWRSGFEAMDFEASRATVTKTNLRDYRIVHFATHGLLNNEHPELSGIVLSLFDKQGQPQDGYLRLQDIYNLKLPVDLVVLSACNTGLGKDVRGEGLIGLTRGFMYAGASSVVASLWKVDDEATSELMQLFYGYMLRDGLSPAAALRKAQLTMSQQKRWQSPYYWAGFVIQGQYVPNERVTRFSSQRLLVGLIAATALGVVGFYAWRRRRKIVL